MQGFNMGRYIPPDQEGLTTANKLANKHPLGARARHLQSKGALVVRFEMPFATWCTNCSPENIIGQGVRFNAEKKKVGNYYSTPIYSFRIKHGVCGKWIEIRTDPRNTAYVVVEGGRKRDTGVDEEGRGIGEILVGGKTGAGAGAGEDPFARLEGKVEDKRVVDEARTRILELQRRQERDWDDPYEVSRRLRKGFRAERKVLEKKEAGKDALKEKMSLGIDIVDEVDEDARRAAIVDFEGGASAAARGVRAKPMFEQASPSPGVGNGIKEKKRKSRKQKTADLVAERKASFRKELAGNTRAVIDPFLNGDNAWEPELKKRKALAKVEGKKASDRDPGRGSQTPKSDALEVPEAKADKNQSTSAALVDYGSDSE